jgi:hypothetical protein
MTHMQRFASGNCSRKSQSSLVASTTADRITVRGRTGTEVKDKLRTKHTELAAGIRTPVHYTVEQCLTDWLETLNTQAQSTVAGYRIMVRHMVGLIGNVKLADLKVRDVQFALGTLAERLSTRSVRLARMILIQAIRNAMVNDLVVRNVADLARRPDVRDGCPDGVSGVPIEQIADAVGRSDNRGRIQASAPAGYPHRRHCAGPAVRDQRKDRRRPELTVRLPRL